MLSNTSPVYSEHDAFLLFVPHPADRFLMLLVSAIRRNTYIRYVIQKNSETLDLLRTLLIQVEDGRFDTYVDDDGKLESHQLDSEQKEWRHRTCRDLSGHL